MEIDGRLIQRVESAQAAYVGWRVAALGGTAGPLGHGGVAARCADHPDHWYANRILLAAPGEATAAADAAAGLIGARLPVRVEVPRPLLDEPLAEALGDLGLAAAWSARAVASPIVVPPPPAVARVRVVRVQDAEGAERFWDAYERCFGEPQPERATHVSALADAPAGLSAHMAVAGTEVVAVALLLVREGVALLADAATREEWRGRGLHALLVAARLADAQRAGADVVTSDVEEGGGSDRNLRRLGLHDGYTRDVWSGPS